MSSEDEKQPLTSTAASGTTEDGGSSSSNHERNSLSAVKNSAVSSASGPSNPSTLHRPSAAPTRAAHAAGYGTVVMGNDVKKSSNGKHSMELSNNNGHVPEDGREAAETIAEKERSALLINQPALLYMATEELSTFNPFDHSHPSHLMDSSRASEESEVGCSAFSWTFRGMSPKFTRFGVLLLITLVSFGAHFVKSSFSSLETYFLKDPKLEFNATKYGSLMSAISLPNLFMPFFGGLFLDSNGHKQGLLLFLGIELVGHVMFALAMGSGHFWLAIAGEVLYGVGSGTTMVAMRAVVSKYFVGNELTFALGVTVAGACVSKTVAKASVAPIAETWGYMGALWYAGFWQVLSLLAGVIYVRMAKSARTRRDAETDEIEPRDLRFRTLLGALKRSTLSFWLVAILHTLFITAYHLFSNYSGHFLYENYGVSPVLAGYISSLMPLIVVICAPIAGLVLDRYGRQLDVLVACNVVTTLAYVLLLQARVGAVFCIVMLAFCESFVPTILFSALPLTVDPSVYGAAFGMAEVLSAISNIISNVFFGYSRDATKSYSQDLLALVALCIVCLAITLFLLGWDARVGGSKLNRRINRSGNNNKALEPSDVDP